MEEDRAILEAKELPDWVVGPYGHVKIPCEDCVTRYLAYNSGVQPT